MKLGKTIGAVAALPGAAILAWVLLLRDTAGTQPAVPAGAGASLQSTALAESQGVDQDTKSGENAVGAAVIGGHSEDRREHYPAEAESLRRRAADLRDRTERRKSVTEGGAAAEPSIETSPSTQKETRTTAERNALTPSTYSQVVARLRPHMERMGLPAKDQERAVDTVANLRDETKALALRDSGSMRAREVVARLVELRQNAEHELAGFIGLEKAASIFLIENSTDLRRTMVADVAAQCAASGVPLSDETADRIAARRSASSIASCCIPPPGDDTLLLEEVKPILQPAQLAHLKQRLAKRYDGR